MAEMKKFPALLFDTRSIQRYIYSGNKLRTNIGASFIVDRLFDDILIDGVLKEMFRADKFPSDDIWDASRDTIEPWTNFEHCAMLCCFLIRRRKIGALRSSRILRANFWWSVRG